MKKWGNLDAWLPAKGHTQGKEQAQDGHTHILYLPPLCWVCIWTSGLSAGTEERGGGAASQERSWVPRALNQHFKSSELYKNGLLQKIINHQGSVVTEIPLSVDKNEHGSPYADRVGMPLVLLSTIRSWNHTKARVGTQAPWARGSNATVESVPLAAAEVLSSALMPAQSRPQGFGTCCIPPRSLHLPVYPSHPSLTAF